MRSCTSAVSTASVADSGAAQDDRTAFSVEPSSPGFAMISPSPSSHSAVAAASRAEPCICSPEVTVHMRFSSAVPCFNSITLEDATACETLPEAGATPTGVDNVVAQGFPVTKEEKGLLFLGTGVSCALPQLAHVLPIADPNHPFHPFIHVPVEQLPSVATLHQLAAEHRQRQQRHQGGDLTGDKHSAAAGAPQPRESQGDLSSGSNHIKVKAFERPGGEKGLRRSSGNSGIFLSLGSAASKPVDTEVNTTVERKCSYASARKDSNSEDQHSSAISSSNRRERGCSDRSQSCSGGTGGISGNQTVTEGKCSSTESSNNRGRGSSGRDGSCDRTSESERISNAVHKAYPGCRLRCQAGEYLQEDVHPAPACVSCFVSWKNSRDPNNRGNVCAVLKLGEDKAVLVDCGKTFRQAALAFCPRYGIRSLNAVLLTHDHQDAVGGLDDLRDMQRFCRPPYRKEALAVARTATHSPAAAKAAPTESGKPAPAAVASEKGEDVTSQNQLALPRAKRQRGEKHAHLAHRDMEASEPHPRDTLGYRPCYTLNCFLGARTYKTICIRYGYIVEASSKMARWVSAAVEQQQRQKSVQDVSTKPELESGAGTEGHTQEHQEGGRAGLLKGGSPIYAPGRVTECGTENKDPEGRTSNGKHVADVHERDAFDAPQGVKTRVLKAAEEGSTTSEICEVGGCVSARDFGTTEGYPLQQRRAPMCFPCSPLDPGWEEAPVFERKVACLAFHLLADEVPLSSPGGLSGARLAVCGSSRSSSSSNEAREPSTATAVAGTTGSGDRGHQQDASALLSSYTKRATSPTLRGISASQATGRKNVTKASLQERTRDSASETLPTNSIDLLTACETQNIEKEENDNSREEIALPRADALEEEEHGGNLSEKTLVLEAKSFVSASGAVNAADADAAGFCEVRIPGINTKVVSFPVFHGGSYVCLGYVIGSREKLVYMSDVKDVPSIVLERLKGIGDLHTLIIDALSEKLHNSHFSVQEALTVAVELQPREVYFVGMTCTLEHSQTNRRLRCWLKRHQESFRTFNGGRESRISHVALAFDGMFLPIQF